MIIILCYIKDFYNLYVLLFQVIFVLSCLLAYVYADAGAEAIAEPKPEAEAGADPDFGYGAVGFGAPYGGGYGGAHVGAYGAPYGGAYGGAFGIQLVLLYPTTHRITRVWRWCAVPDPFSWP